MLVLRWRALVLKEALGLVISSLGRLDLLDFGVLAALATLSTTEGDPPEEDGNMSHDHADQASCNADHDADKYWDEDMHDNTTEEAAKATVPVVMTV